jgi:hypothetical protein
VANHGAETPLVELVAAIKGRWVCEQGHQQMKEELGLDHCECRNWLALHHHVLLTMIAFGFLQHVRLREKNGRQLSRNRAAATSDRAPDPSTLGSGAHALCPALSTLSSSRSLLAQVVNQPREIHLPYSKI